MRRYGESFLYGILGLVFLVIIQVLVLSLIMGGVAAHIQLPVLDKLPLLQTLFTANTSSALQYLLKTPILIVEQLDIQNQQIWAYYLMPISFLMHISLVWLVLYFYRQQALQGRLWLALCLLLVSVMYMRVAACCTTEPGWVFDIGLLAMVYQPLNDTEFWQDLYLYLKPWLLAMQFVLASVGFLLLLNQRRRMKFLSK